MSGKAVCQTCGDSGFPEALNYCVKCEEAAEHTYCLEKLPEDLNEDTSWICESCTLTAEVGSSDKISSVPVVRGQCIGIYRQEAPHPRRKKRRWSISYSASQKMARRNRSKRPCCMIKCADTITQPKVARQKDASPGFRKRRGQQSI